MNHNLGSHVLARGLPWTAFFLAPVQRIARYPLLIEAIERNSSEKDSDLRHIRKARLVGLRERDRQTDRQRQKERKREREREREKERKKERDNL